MASVADLFAARPSRPIVAVDVSPPRSSDPAFADELTGIGADLVSIAYSPGRAVRMDTLAASVIIREKAKLSVIVNIATRDMNRLALQMHLLGIEALGLENVLVVKGDDFGEKDQGRVQAVHDYRPTELLADVRRMNEGSDFRGLRLAKPTRLCAGAIIDLAADPQRQAELTLKKAQAGADFFITQAVYDAGPVEGFWRAYKKTAGRPLDKPVFYGVQMLMKDGVAFGNPPPGLMRRIESGGSNVELALGQVARLRAMGCRGIYLVPPIFKGGARDYAAAGKVIREMRGR
jgi:5,10-methylenetetrahydrofolate reductase